jgi:hypothetical protein
VETGDYLGDLTDELEEFGSGSYIEKFVSGGQKNYGFTVFCPATENRTTKYKVKGITLNYNNFQGVNFTSLRKMILDVNTTLHVQILRRSRGNMAVYLYPNPNQRSTSSSLRSAG